MTDRHWRRFTNQYDALMQVLQRVPRDTVPQHVRLNGRDHW